MEIPSDKGEAAHSDGDVLIHAVIDALLGAACLGDIGELFPPADEKWRDASSAAMLQDVRERVSGAGWRIVNVDCVISCERPSILPHRDAVRKSLARLLDIPAERVFLKGKSGESLDAVGRGEAVEALCVCLLKREK